VRKEDMYLNYVLDSSTYCNFGRYLNSSMSESSEKKNCEIKLAVIETSDGHELIHFISSCRNI